MITFGHQSAVPLAAVQQHKSKNQPELQQDHLHREETAPGGVNVLLGGVMMSSMVLFLLWMCYFCRWKDSKFDTTTEVTERPPQPFWIDVNSSAYYEALQWSLQQDICEVPETSWIPEIVQETPPRYETVITPPPVYEDAMKENYMEKKQILHITENNKMHTI